MASTKPQVKVVFVLGGPGSGKGTQCERICHDYSFKHLSAGDLLRKERNSPESKHGKLIADIIREGKIVPVEITVNLLKNAMEEYKKETGKNKFLVDGFPRNKNNVDGWHEVMDEYAEVPFMLFFDCPEEVMERRLLERAETSGRTDDNRESIMKRFRTYVEDTKPVIDSFAKINKVRRVNANNTKDKVYEDVKPFIESIMC